ncbi:Hypothetical protein D9617_11g008560 [Elsinoe fawcettii]|nr:Hypothetical protein D9617_11g008560 [Elsinoe fawcettii]
MHLSLLTPISLLLAGVTSVSAQASRTYKAAPVPAGNTYYGNASFAKLSKTKYFDSDHFRVYNTTAKRAAEAHQHLEGAYDCFINVMGHDDTGVSIYNSTKTGPYWKSNVFTAKTDGVLGFVTSDYQTGLAYMVMNTTAINMSSVLVHEYGHILTYHAVNAKFWQSSRAIGWAEPIAQLFSELYTSSKYCASSRTKVNDKEGWTLFSPEVVIYYSYLTLIDANKDRRYPNNEYFTWPFLHYLSMNIDKYPGLGRDTAKKIFRRYDSSANETPFHTLQRIIGNTVTVQSMVAKYWARMSYIDFQDVKWYTNYYYSSWRVNYDNLNVTAANTYRVKTALQPRYLGANIIPLLVNGTGQNTIRITASMPFSATLAILGADKNVTNTRYLTVPAVVAAQAKNVVKQIKFSLQDGEDATLSVANTPNALLMYDARGTAEGDVAKGLDYTVKFTGKLAPRGKSWVKL